MRNDVASIAWFALLAGIAILVVVGFIQVHGEDPLLFTRVHTPSYIMNTRCEIKAVVPANRMDLAGEALASAEAALRSVEFAMSPYLKGSDIQRLNSAPAERVEVSKQTLEVMGLSQQLAQDTEGTFDVTYAPLFALWAQAPKNNRLPTPTEINQAMEASGWKHLQLHADAIEKLQENARVDLGGIAKGYAIDKAAKALMAAGVAGGMVNVGGDVRCFGKKPGGGPWKIGVQDPFNITEGKFIATLYVTEGAVCTSGNYHRYRQIDGVRYSHIVDPRTGRPTEASPSVTVYAPTAAIADAWATALSVLGPDGLELIEAEKNVEAMMVVGDEASYDKRMSSGFAALLAEEKPTSPVTPPAPAQPVK